MGGIQDEMDGKCLCGEQLYNPRNPGFSALPLCGFCLKPRCLLCLSTLADGTMICWDCVNWKENWCGETLEWAEEQLPKEDCGFHEDPPEIVENTTNGECQTRRAR